MKRILGLAAAVLVGLAGCSGEPRPVQKTGNPFAERAAQVASQRQSPAGGPRVPGR